MTLPSTLALVVSLTLGTAIESAPVTPPQEAAASATESAARALVPLLRNVKRRLDSQWQLQQGSLPPSPFTGRQSTVVAVTLGKGSVKVEPKVAKAMDQLLAWRIGTTTPDAPEAVLFDHWLVQLTLKAAGLRDPGSTTMECDAACVVDRFTRLDERFGTSQKDREELRDQVLLEALVAAVDELEP